MTEFDRTGLLHLRGFFSSEETATIASFSRAVWNEPRNANLVVDVGDGPLANRRMRLADAPASVAHSNHKVTDLYLESADFQDMFLSRKIVDVVGPLLGGRPLICNSLNFTRGSEQRPHIDSWYMTPPGMGPMVALAVPLEPYTATNGPLFYLPGSHLIPPYVFSDGRYGLVPGDQDACDAYLFGELRDRGIRPVEVHADPGDLIIWHGQTVHGGARQIDPGATRRSVVVHYWREGDIEATDTHPWLAGLSVKTEHGAWLDRGHQAVGAVHSG